MTVIIHTHTTGPIACLSEHSTCIAFIAPCQTHCRCGWRWRPASEALRKTKSASSASKESPSQQGHIVKMVSTGALSMVCSWLIIGGVVVWSSCLPPRAHTQCCPNRARLLIDTSTAQVNTVHRLSWHAHNANANHALWMLRKRGRMKENSSKFSAVVSLILTRALKGMQGVCKGEGREYSDKCKYRERLLYYSWSST